MAHRENRDRAEASERLAEIGTILATGLQRLSLRQSSGELPDVGESSLHFTPDQSGDAPPCSAEVPP
jgi:hypothetical protein